MGVPWRDAPTIGNLLGTRMVLNEFVAYSQLGPLKSTLDPQVVHDRDVRALRLRELQLDRHPDRRHRRAGAEPPPRPGAARPARDVRRHAGELHDGDDRRIPAVSDGATSTTSRRRPMRCARARREVPRDAPSCSGPGSATSPDSLERRGLDAVRRAAALAGSRASSGHEGRLVVGTRAGRTIAALAGRVSPVRRARPADGDLRGPRARACWASRRSS